MSRIGDGVGNRIAALGLLLSVAANAYPLHGVARSSAAVEPTALATGAERRAEKPPKDRQKTEDALTKEGRLAFIRRAQVWVPTNVSTMDLKRGPQGADAFAADEAIACDYLETKLAGSSRKFACRIGAGDNVKVRYGATNGEVEGSVLASRLLWALGFGADRVYPVRVTCQGCPPDPWTKPASVSGEQVFDLAVIERKPFGHEMKTRKGEGWAWRELDLVDESEGGAPKAQRDALTLLAAFMQHTDSKPEQQRLLCLPGGMRSDGGCDTPFLMLHDVGLTFGRANFWNRAATGSVNLTAWAATPVWRDATACVARLSKSFTGTLNDPKIGEAGRGFLARLLSELRDTQLDDLFEVARADRRTQTRRGSKPSPLTTVEEWVSAFKQKRAEIAEARCPS